MRVLVFISVVFCFLFVNNSAVEAKLLPQAQGNPKNVSRVSTGISVYPRVRADRRAVMVNFGNLQNAKAVSYLLTYQTNGQGEAAMGSINMGQPSQNAEILIGTCSHNVCRYHSGVTNAKLEITYTNLAGKKYLKRYRIRV